MNYHAATNDTVHGTSYRPEIDGLRTVAIVPVVLFHAGLPYWSGGFVGVDIFFVISGFLITSIIIQELDAGSFSYGRFYERRIRRLIPPLLVMLAFTYVGATLLLEPMHYEEFAQSIPSVLTATSNWFFLFQVDYFDGAAETKPLLHMWSLAVEEQFYLIFPFIVASIFSIKYSLLRPAVVYIAIFSFIYSSYLVFSGSENTAFFNSFARFWEILFGCFLATRIIGDPSEKIAVVARYIGAILIGVAVFGFNGETTPFPGPSALLPVVGTALIIWAGTRGTDRISRILKSRPFVEVGKASYSWYLFHWPIAVFVPLAISAPEEYAVHAQLFGSAIGLALAFLSLRYLEDPIRRKQMVSSRQGIYAIFATGVIASFAMASPAFFPELDRYRLETLYGKTGAAISTIQYEGQYYQKYLNINYTGTSDHIEKGENQGITCSFDRRNTIDRIIHCLNQQASAENILVIGDSVGRDTFRSLREAFPSKNFLMIHQSGCIPADTAVGRANCFTGLLDVIDRARTQIAIDAVVLAFRYLAKDWSLVESSLGDIRQRFDRVFMIGVVPVLKDSPAAFLQKLDADQQIPIDLDKSDTSMVPWSYALISDAARQMAEQYQIVYIDVEPEFCPGDSCLLWVDKDTTKPMMWDRYHLTRYGMSFLSAHLRTATQLDSENK